MLVLIIGNLGSGKTLIMLILAIFDKIREIWSNFEINVPNYRKLEIPDLFNLKDNIILLLDEGYSWIESRVSTSALNEYISSIIFHTRKTFSDIYLTTPMLSTIDKRFRKMCNYLIICKHRENLNSDDFNYTIINTNTNTYSNKILSYQKAKKYFKLYNTYEKVESYRKKGLEFNIIKKYPERLKQKVKEIVELVKHEFNGNITHDKVKDVLLDYEIDLNYEPSVYSKLKRKRIDDNNNKDK